MTEATTQLTLRFGLQPPAEATVAWGARFIFKLTEPLDFLHDRQDVSGGEAQKDALCEDLNRIAFRKLFNDKVKAVHLNPWDSRRVEWEQDGIHFAMDPKASHGYLYAVAWR
jgi:hypothetical protein